MKECTKKKLNKFQAMLFVAEAKRSLDHKRREKRYYKCNICGYYHTTSKK